MIIRSTPIPGIVVVETKLLTDKRGYFYRGFCNRELSPILEDRTICQINVSRTEEVGAIRGLHFQHAPHAEMKLIRCLRGRVWDVALDLRRDSPTFLWWHAEELSSDSARMLVIPEGCAHGFQVLEAGSELLYLHTAHYEPNSEDGVRYDDPSVQLEWPLPVRDLSQRDSSHPWLSSNFMGIAI